MTLSPYITAFFAVIAYAALPVITKKMHLVIPPYAYIAVTMFFLYGLAAMASFIFEKDFSLTFIKPVDWSWLAVFALINCAGFALMIITVAKIPVAEYQLIYLLAPIVTGLLAFLILKEPFSWRYVLGLSIMAAGLYIALKK